MGFDLTGYVTVNQRLKFALDKWPELRVQESEPRLIETGNQTFIQVTTTIWRTADDPLPCIASCWEPYPGQTPYTRGSEQQNASTSSLGRCLGLMGVAIEAGMASKDEVVLAQQRNRSDDGNVRHPAQNQQPATNAQITYLKRLMTAAGEDVSDEAMHPYVTDRHAASKKIEQMKG